MPTDKLKWFGINNILERQGPFQRQDFEASDEMLEQLQMYVKILIIGAGGLGCELLKDIALLGFCDIHVIDMDTIDLSNLNRQFLFRDCDIGKSKAITAAAYIEKRLPHCKVTPHFKKIQEFNEEFYRQFNVVVCGLDSVIARRWINSMLASLVKYDQAGQPDPATVIPLVDGGTEGFKGNCLVVLYGVTGCLECSLDLYPPQVNYPLCTIANTPRLPEHCIEYVRVLLWPQEKPFPGENLDGDNPEHIQWIYEKSLERANSFGIEGINYRLVKGVVKSIIPAVASTNAVIASACATEVFKLVTLCYDYLNNYMNFSDLDGIYTYAFPIEKKENCIACSGSKQSITMSKTSTLSTLIEHLKESPSYQMKSPSVVAVKSDGDTQTLYMPIQSVSAQLNDNLKLSLADLRLFEGQNLLVSDETITRTLTFELSLS